jgi:hypothetical protein
MTRAPMTSDTYSRKVMALRSSVRHAPTDRKFVFNRAVIETVRNPVVARAVARGLRHDRFEKA